jgi:hypothetical protein
VTGGRDRVLDLLSANAGGAQGDFVNFRIVNSIL